MLLNPSMCCVARGRSATRRTPGGVEVAGTLVKFSDSIKLFGIKLDPAIKL